MSQYASVESVGRKPLKSALVFLYMLFVPDLQLVAWTEVRPGRGPGCASCRTRCRPPCPEHAAGRHFPRPRTQGVIFADNRIFLFPASLRPPVRTVWGVPSAGGTHAGAPRSAFREGWPCLLRSEGTPVRPAPGRRACGLALRSRRGEHACDQSHVLFLSPVSRKGTQKS